MEFKGTKGKWVQQWNNSDSLSIRSEEDLSKPICDLSSYYYSKRVTSFDELRANALLISKAPEMLEELKHLVKALKAINSFGATKPIIEHAEQLIKEATEL